MKTKRPYIIMLALISLTAACDQNKSGPVEPVATPASTEGAAEPAESKGKELFELAGPATPIVAGSEQQIELVVKPSTGFKINKRFEWNFEFHPNDAVELGSPTIGMEQVKLEDSKATIPVKVTAKSAGDHTLTATGNFSVCNDDKCELYRDREVTFKLAATDG